MRYLILLLLFPVSAYAADPGWDFSTPQEQWHGFKVKEVYVHTWTHHARNNKRLNDYNRGGGVRLDNNIVIGTYYNSIYRNSHYVGYVYDFNSYVSIAGGLITGYIKNDYAPFWSIVLTAPKINLPYVRHLRFHLNLIPAPRQSIAHITIGYQFQ